MTQKPEKLVRSKRHVWESCTESLRGSRTSLKPTLLPAKLEDSVAEKLVEHRNYASHTYPNNVPIDTGTHPREFSSWFRGPTKNIHPDYVITSHQSSTQLPSIQSKTQLHSLLLKTQLQSFQSKTQLHSLQTKSPLPSLPVYMSVLEPTVKWNADVQSSFIRVENPQVNEQHDDNCWCESCTNARYRAGHGLDLLVPRPTTSPATDRQTFFRDNIVTFCNQYTMTPCLNDAACGSSKSVVPRLVTTEVGTSGTTRNRPQSSKSRRRNSILKKTHYDNYEDLRCFEKALFDQKLTISCTDDSSSNGRTTNICPSSTCLRSLNNTYQVTKGSDEHKRKMLYNEGISDDVAKQFCVMHKKHPPTRDLNQRTCSRLSVGGRCYRDSSDNYIPYSHNKDSKYHRNCKEQPLPLVRGRSYILRGVTDDECHTLELRPLVVKRSSAGACSMRSRCISLPRKLLTSEKNIEAFLMPKPVLTRQYPP